MLMEDALAALLAMISEPLELPVAAGVNQVRTVMLWPGAKVLPATLPCASKPAPDTDTFSSVTAAEPSFVSVTYWLFVLGNRTLPNCTLLGLTLRLAVPVAGV